MSEPGKVARSIPQLVQKFRDGKALTALEQEWVMEELERRAAAPITTSLTDPADNQVRCLHDIVAFNVPPPITSEAFELNMIQYLGPCEAPYHVYQMIARMFQNEVLAQRELFESRGDVEGLKKHLTWQAPQLPYRVTKRAEQVNGECPLCVELKGGKRAAA